MDMQTGKRKRTRGIAMLAVLMVVLSGALGAFVYVRTQPNQGAVTPGWGADKIRQYANKLKEQGLVSQAANAYESYLSAARVTPEVRANIYFLLGEAFMKQEQYEDALAYLYKAQIADTAGDLKKDIGINVVTCLERLGKPLDAQAALGEQVQMGTEQYQNARGAVVARIGDRVITMGEINDELAKLPDWFQEKYKDEKQKALFVQQYVANQLLLKKGHMLQYDRDPEVQKQLQEVKDNLIIRKVIQNEVSDEVTVDPEDVKTYYEVHKDKFTEKTDKGEVVKPFDEVKDEVEKLYRLEKMQVKMQALLSDLLEENNAVILYQPPAEETTADETAAAGTVAAQGTNTDAAAVKPATNEETAAKVVQTPVPVEEKTA